MADVTVTEVVEVVTVAESVVAVTVADSGSPGTPGPAIELQTSATHIQWKVAGAASWINLVALADLQGSAGEDGTDGVDGVDGDDGAAATISLGTVSTGAPGSSVIITEGGTANARIFNFTIPRGDAGTNGTNGTNGIDGDDGREIEIQNSGTQIQWRYVGDVSWTNIVALSAIKGDTGAQGATEYVGNIDGGDAASTYGDLPSIDGGGAAG
jgi:hypothetical protein